MHELPKVIILLGPVGAGKSTIGRLIQKVIGGRFLSIEEFFIKNFGSYENYSANRDSAYRSFKNEINAVIGKGEIPVIFEEIAILTRPHLVFHLE